MIAVNILREKDKNKTQKSKMEVKRSNSKRTRFMKTLLESPQEEQIVQIQDGDLQENERKKETIFTSKKILIGSFVLNLIFLISIISMIIYYFLSSHC